MLSTKGIFEARRHHADDGCCSRSHLEQLANYIRVASETPLPQPMTDQNDANVWPIFIAGKDASQFRLHVQHREELRRDVRTKYPLGFRASIGQDRTRIEKGRY